MTNPAKVGLPDGSSVALEEPIEHGCFGVVARRDADGELLWSVVPPGPGATDAWVSLAVVDDRVSLTSWSCWRVNLDLESGRELARTFTK